jgi:hypothetical protein
MSELMTETFWDQQSGQLVDDIGIVLVTLSHPDLLEPLHCASMDIDVMSRGETFLGWPMSIKLPTAGSSAKRGTLLIEDVDPRIGEVIRGLKGEIGLLFEYVSRDDPDDLILDHGGLLFSNISGNDGVISGEITGIASINDTWPIARATPDTSPGVFVA